MTLFHAEKFCYLVNALTASVQRLCKSGRQFLIYRTFVILILEHPLVKIR